MRAGRPLRSQGLHQGALLAVSLLLCACSPQPDAVPGASGGPPAATTTPNSAATAAQGDQPTAASSASQPMAGTATSAPSPGIRIEARLQPQGPALQFILIADNQADQAASPDTPLEVRAIEVRRSDATLLQRIDGLQTRTPWGGAAPGFEVLDMNFDGYADIRLIESQPAGPNTPYLNWLYDPSTARYVANAALDELAAPRFDAKTREVLSDWRDGPTTTGRDIYTYRDGELLATRRETRTYQRPGVYTLEVARRVGDTWQRVERRQGRDPT